MYKRIAVLLTMAVLGSAVVAQRSDRPGRGPTTRPAGRGKRQQGGVGRTGSPPARAKAKGGPTEEQEKQFLAELEQRDPRFHGRLMACKEGKPALYRSVLREAYRFRQRTRNMPPAGQRAAMVARDARIELWWLHRKFQTEKDEAEKAKLLKQIEATIAKQFDAEMLVSGHRVSAIEQQLKSHRDRIEQQLQTLKAMKDRLEQQHKAHKALKDRLKQQKANRRETIQERLDHLLKPRRGRRPGATTKPARKTD